MRQCVAYLILVFSCVACETTGDPSSGGLWNWSEKKAINRQNALKKQAGEFLEAQATVTQQNQQLKHRQKHLIQEEKLLQSQLSDLIKERDHLLAQIEKFKISRSLQDNRLNQLIEQYQLGQTENQRLFRQFTLLNDVTDKKTFLGRITEQNQKLNDEIILLLGG